ncbi:hypothetical protein [Ramlibacter sp. Leaf400]|uniref:hypothetical protein n=1 Tax=Ramlibacter sp. Leaf400 TaxID=1736365 RepID=UPI0006F4CEDB|nr:hypothetical protein [Ramlibacter sp. Leaf400]KQT10698.1 hypothetical protein ASG30_07745 [Ramlibacter sp. Leaf400]
MDQQHSPQLERIEQLLLEGNRLRGQAIALQQEALATQRSLIDEQRANLAKASQVNDQALLLQRRARRIVTAIIPILVVLVGYVSWLLFGRPYA